MLPKTKEKKQARIMRQNGESVSVIASKLNVSVSAVCAWTRDIELTEDQKIKLFSNGNAHYLKLRNNAFRGGKKVRDKWREIRKQQQEQGRIEARKGNLLHSQGCMLYWGEGGKGNNVTLGNSDGNLVKLFVKFLRECFQLENAKIKLRIRAHADNGKSLDEIRGYWVDLLGVSSDNITSLKFFSDKRNAKVKKNKHVYGFCDLIVCSSELLHRIFGAIQEYAGFDEPRWLETKRSGYKSGIANGA